MFLNYYFWLKWYKNLDKNEDLIFDLYCNVSVEIKIYSNFNILLRKINKTLFHSQLIEKYSIIQKQINFLFFHKKYPNHIKNLNEAQKTSYIGKKEAK